MALFFLLLWAPLVQNAVRLAKLKPLVENRSREPLPTQWRDLFRADNPFCRQVERFFDDRYGFRGELIRIKNQLDYSFFHESRRIVVGKGGWLFYKSIVEEEQVYIERASSEKLHLMFRRMLHLQRYLEARGIALVLMPIPLKNTIYPEYLPANTARRKTPNGFQKLRSFLLAHPEIITIDAEGALLRLKESMPVFHKTDFHWNDVAGAHLARSLVNTLGQLSGLGDCWSMPIEMEWRPMRDGGQNGALGLIWPLQEISLFLRGPKRECDLSLGKAAHSDEWVYVSKQASRSDLLPPTVMYGDSFERSFCRAGYLSYFSVLQKHWNWNFDKEFGNWPPQTKFLVIQHVESVLNMFLDDSRWPEEIKKAEGARMLRSNQ